MIARWFRFRNLDNSSDHCLDQKNFYTQYLYHQQNIHLFLWIQFVKINQKERKSMMERLLDITVWYIYTFSSFSLSQFFLISRVIIEILAIELDLIIMNFTKGQEFYREISRQTKQNRSARNCLAWNKRVVAQVKNTRRGEEGDGKNWRVSNSWPRYWNSLLYARLCNEMSPVLEQSRCSFVLLSFSREGWKRFSVDAPRRRSELRLHKNRFPWIHLCAEASQDFWIKEFIGTWIFSCPLSLNQKTFSQIFQTLQFSNV